MKGMTVRYYISCYNYFVTISVLNRSLLCKLYSFGTTVFCSCLCLDTPFSVPYGVDDFSKLSILKTTNKKNAMINKANEPKSMMQIEATILSLTYLYNKRDWAKRKKLKKAKSAKTASGVVSPDAILALFENDGAVITRGFPVFLANIQ